MAVFTAYVYGYIFTNIFAHFLVKEKYINSRFKSIVYSCFYIIHTIITKVMFVSSSISSGLEF